MKREIVDGKTRVTVHWNELANNKFASGKLTATAVLSPLHPLYREFCKWFKARHESADPSGQVKMTKRQARRFLRETGRRGGE